MKWLIAVVIGAVFGYGIGSLIGAVRLARERSYYVRRLRRFERAFRSEERSSSDTVTLRVVDESREDTPLKFGDE